MEDVGDATSLATSPTGRESSLVVAAVSVSRRVPFLVALVLLALVGPVVQEYTGATAPRYALAAALWEHQTIDLDQYADILFIDYLEIDGHLYSDKAPGQPFASVPAYGLAKLAGAEPAADIRLRGDLGYWFVTLWSSVLPALALVVMMVRGGQVLGSRAAAVGAAGIAFGTLLLPFASQLYGHVLAAALVFGSWRILVGGPTRLRVLVAGLLAGLAVTVEYPVVLIVAVLAAWIVVRHRRRIVEFVLGGLPAFALLAWYQAALLGDPFATSYSAKHEGARGIEGVGVPSVERGIEILFGYRGLLIFSPIVASALWGLWRLARTRGDLRDEAVLSLAVFGAMFLLQAGWPNAWGGSEMPGPRYMIPALPFLAIGVAQAWTERRRLVMALIAWSAFCMTWPLIARHLVAADAFLVESQLTDVKVAGFMPTLFTMAVGPLGWAVQLACIVLAIRAAERATAPSGPPLDATLAT